MPMRDWRQTIWARLGDTLARPQVYHSIAVAVFLAACVPSLYVWIRGETLLAPLTAFGLQRWSEFPDSTALLEGATPELRAAFPQRFEALVRRIIPILTVVGVGLGAGGALMCLWLGSFLRRHASGGAASRNSPATTVVRGAPVSWGAALATVAGLLAHLPYLTHSFDRDESWAALHLSRSWLAWASTWQGWEVHMGGELLGGLAYALVGFNDVIMRLPSAVASAIGLGIVFRWTERRYGALPGWLTVGVLCALPLWAEQTAHLRGYGLLFLAGAWNLAVLWDLLDGRSPGGESSVLASLFASLIIGGFAHVFFLFYGVAVLVLVAWRARTTGDPVAGAGLAWGVIALAVPAVLYLPGLPATVYQTIELGQIEPAGTFLAKLIPLLVGELGLGDTRIASAAAAIFLSCWIAGLTALSSTDRRRILIVLTMAIGVPLLMRPVFVGSRFFIHLLPLAFVATLPIAHGLARLRPAGIRYAATALALAGLWAIPQPYRRLPSVNLRDAIAELARQAQPADRIAIDNACVSARVYVPDSLRPVYVNMGRPLTVDADVLVSCRGRADQWPGYAPVAVVPGENISVVIYRRDS